MTETLTLLKHVLVLGASVSAGSVAPSPFQVIAERYQNEVKIDLLAIPGASSFEILPQVKKSQLKRATLVTALDLFFWDPSYHTCDEVKGQVAQFFEMIQETPVLIATLPDKRQCAILVNEKIKSECNTHPQCALLDLNPLIQAYGKDQSIWADKLHPNLKGTTLLADHLLATLEEKFK